MIKYFMMLKLRPFFYGLAELSPSAIDIFLKVYLLVYFNQVLGLSATITSFVIGASAQSASDGTEQSDTGHGLKGHNQNS